MGLSAIENGREPPPCTVLCPQSFNWIRSCAYLSQEAQSIRPARVNSLEWSERADRMMARLSPRSTLRTCSSSISIGVRLSYFSLSANRLGHWGRRMVSGPAVSPRAESIDWPPEWRTTKHSRRRLDVVRLRRVHRVLHVDCDGANGRHVAGQRAEPQRNRPFFFIKIGRNKKLPIDARPILRCVAKWQEKKT